MLEQCGRLFLVFELGLWPFSRRTSVLASHMVCAVVCLDAPSMESARLAASIKNRTAKDTLSIGEVSTICSDCLFKYPVRVMSIYNAR